ncbi:hypothetical protein Pcinc_022626 [Petrolisthes cinctipes]|uniref:Uncharacterized protein n=1 Tax=Petrolisthes cinctipes TaxID=88211 RepID=A0AAE1FEA0_PETCI|nr:hypothetical protein Pcinc_022626 [Petrolisthes cinctipes]
MASYKWPPKLDKELSYESWRKDIEIWSKITDLSKKKQALAIHLSLDGRARVATSEIEVRDLKADNGVEVLLGKLDGLFLVDEGRRQFTAFQDLYNLRRQGDGNVREFVAEFEHTYFKFTKQGMTLPDSALAFMLLASCNLSDNEQQLVMSAISDVSLKNMKGALSRIFHGEISVQSSGQIHKTVMGDVKSEPVLLGGGCDDYDADSGTNKSLFVRGSQRGRVRSSGRGYRPRGPRSVPRGVGRRQNPLGPDGRITRCVVCDSRFHWARECPNAYENMENYGCSFAEGDNDTAGTSNAVNFSLFVGYANCEHENKLSKLVEEAKYCAVLDSGVQLQYVGLSGWRSF